ncbi:hypothetical protein CMI47_18485 [Candidatus Pacearchaeota archaeon]|nr:hypothetical protein [Candidatus Pacearchaeota archaeon]|tara:strand:- start:1551 stop:4166 length:2616 start_codon:yes stop_codon:yes gene_type:complete
MSAKECRKIDLNLISGSRETFRTAVGGYWELVSSSYGEQLEAIDYNGSELLTSFITEITANLDLRETISDTTLVYNERFPVRLVGNSNTVKDDNHWNRVLLGGTFESIDYSPIYSDAVYNDYSFDYSLPYSAYEKEVINYILQADTDISNEVQISYDYWHYLPQYQSYIENIDEKLIPNMYLLKMFQLATTPGTASLGEDIYNFVTLEETFGNAVSLLNEMEEYFTVEDGYLYANDMTDSSIYQYYSSSVVITPLSASTSQGIVTQFENIIFDNNILTDVTAEDTYSQMNESIGMIPFYMKFNWTADHTNSTFVTYMEESDLTAKFMKTLKEVFNEEIDDLSPSTLTYAVETTSNDESLETETITEGVVTENVAYRSMDFFKMLIYIYNNFNSTTDNCYFLGPRNINRFATMDTIGAYRFMNSENVIEMINNTIEYGKNSSNFGIDSIDELYSLDSRYRETLAYRIEKIGGPPRGDSQTQNVLQNFWFFNTADFMEGTDFYDSQVKYNENYTYNIYAYVLVVGPKYSFSDLRLTRKFGQITLNSGEEDESEAICLEFYDPVTGVPAVQLFSEDDNLSDYNEFATNEQVVSEYEYLADFYLNYEPCIQLVEIPIYAKTLKILDNPANRVDLGPYQMMDTSQRIGFTADYEAYENNLLYPSTISSTDDTLKEEYLHGHDFLSSSYIDLKSISYQRTVEVYRTEELPTSLADFDNKLIKTVDLLEPDTNDNVSTAEILDKITANKKYYYIFRIMNEQNMPGQLSEIYEAQLINDGGYLYSIFNILFESDLEESPPTNPAVPFKKIFQLKPNFSQVSLNVDDVDFDEESYTQLENVVVGDTDDTIFDKTFKIRLTSKKTGKMIDLNITYNLTTEL